VLNDLQSAATTRIETVRLEKKKEKQRIAANIFISLSSLPLCDSFSIFFMEKALLAADRRVTAPLAIVATPALQSVMYNVIACE
jgi:hypothetical protein